MDARGKIFTFYSYKGGVGRSMAVANIGVLLATMGKKVLLVDWDLEAPGLEEYFRTIPSRPKQKPGGLLSLLNQAPNFHSDGFEPLITSFQLQDGNEVTLLDSGSDTTAYTEQVAMLSWKEYFEDRNGAEYLEEVRQFWLGRYDFVLIDSRTGITDSGGVCTIQLPDTLVLLFAANHQNLRGIQRVAKAAKSARERLAFSRLALSVLPVPSRFDGRVEQSISNEWLDRFADALASYYEDWLPMGVPPRKLIEQIKIPYIPLYSFDEALPVLTQGTSDPEQIGFYYHNLAKLLMSEETLAGEQTPGEKVDLSVQTEGQVSRIGGRRSRGSAQAMISSSAMDLPAHRKEVIDACVRAAVYPIAMENLPTSDEHAVRASLELVNEADVYICILGWRYGWVPPGQDLSITEMEFNRAVECGISILVFTMAEDHPVTLKMVETSQEAQRKLAAFKERSTNGRVRGEFHSPEELRGLVVHALGDLARRREQGDVQKAAPSLHPPTLIPIAPQPYIAHPYSLLQTAQVVGRQVELNLLTDWVTTNKQVPANVRLFNVVAVGGMGKSALTWKWFNDIAPNELPNRAGWMWWSFYESDAHYENFIIRALAYASGRSEQAVRELKPPEREDQLWRLLDERPFVLVLDGLERILMAYARMDAARMLDDDLDERTANRVARAHSLPESAAQSFVGKHQLRFTADQRAGQFLRRLARVRTSRLLISTRLYPAELQVDTGDPLPGCYAVFLGGLTDDDALNLWREFKVGGSREQLLPLFRSFGNYPLLVRALAGEVASYRPAPRDFDQWRADNPGFDPAAQLDLKNATTHVLEYALRGLGETQREVLHTLAAFRMPATWDTLRALLVGAEKPCADNRTLDMALTELEDRGLMGWDKQANRYRLHSIVRVVVWAALDPSARRDLYRELYAYFDAVPRPPEWDKVERLEDLTPAVELFDKLIGLERYKDALVIFRDHLNEATLYRLSANRLRVELLERLFPDGVNAPPRLEGTREQTYTLNALAFSYRFGGEPSRAATLFRRAVDIDEREKDAVNLAITLCNLAEADWPCGQLREAEMAIRRALGISRQADNRHEESASLRIVGTALFTRGEASQSQIALRRSLAVFVAERDLQSEGVITACLAQRHLWLGQSQETLPLAERAWELAHVQRLERDFIRTARLHGEALLGLGDFASAEDRLHHALTRARAVNLIEEELPALTALAELHRQRRQFGPARELLEPVWASAERGPYPLFHADARNVLARIERDEGQRDAAIAAATRAYELAWCDGPPYAYHFGLTNAKQLLAELGAPEPKLPPFDASKFEPMPDVDLNPKDEFWVDPDSLTP